eukprot:GFYU01002008.1.p1 GENE.GFYU01002008.1~~GFYU01002008.1.p1  ORF type:complete len:320 (-),score=83.56 GFYU01002008.1:244-1203(-)
MSATTASPVIQRPEVTKASGPIFGAATPFIFGGLSGMSATCVIQPIDMVKTRIQLAGEGGAAAKTGPIQITRDILRNEGVGAFYSGLSAAVLRQASYTTVRLGTFRVVSDALKTDGQALPLYKKAFAGLTAGAIGAIFGTPADLALIRMQADGTLPAEMRRNYRGVGDALVRISREEGVLSMWKGTTPTVVRAMGLNIGMLASYDQTKETLVHQFHFNPAHFSTQLMSSSVAGFFAAALSLPFDFIKTRVQKQQPNPVTGQLPYKNTLDCAMKVAKEEGMGRFYRGFWTYYGRIAPHAMLTLLFVEQFTAAARKYQERD